MKIIDQNNWKRKEHFEFFSSYDEPFFSIVAEVDCTSTYNNSKLKGGSFFASYLHKSLIAVNQIDEFKYRIDGDKIVVFDQIHAGSTIGRKDETFAFSFIEYNSSFDIFAKSLENEVIKVQNSTGLGFKDDALRKDVIHYSPIPWIRFTGLTHARNFGDGDSIPKIVFGKITNVNDKLFMPIGVHAHHGLMDGLHVGKFLDLFQNLLNE